MAPRPDRQADGCRWTGLVGRYVPLRERMRQTGRGALPIHVARLSRLEQRLRVLHVGMTRVGLRTVAMGVYVVQLKARDRGTAPEVGPFGPAAESLRKKSHAYDWHERKRERNGRN